MDLDLYPGERRSPSTPRESAWSFAPEKDLMFDAPRSTSYTTRHRTPLPRSPSVYRRTTTTPTRLPSSSPTSSTQPCTRHHTTWTDRNLATTSTNL